MFDEVCHEILGEYLKASVEMKSLQCGANHVAARQLQSQDLQHFAFKQERAEAFVLLCMYIQPRQGFSNVL